MDSTGLAEFPFRSNHEAAEAHTEVLDVPVGGAERLLVIEMDV